MAKCSGLNPKGPYLSIQKEKEKENLCVVLTYSMKRASENRKFHVAVVQHETFSLPSPDREVPSICVTQL